MSIKLVYFAWVRERIGKADELFEPPANVKTIGELIAHLAARDEAYAYAFERGDRPQARKARHADSGRA